MTLWGVDIKQPDCICCCCPAVCRRVYGVGLELCVLRCAWEGNDVANVLHACDEEDESLEAEAESSVWA